jgi:hypothetical protein
VNIRKFYFSLPLAKVYFTRHLKEYFLQTSRYFYAILNPITVFVNMLITQGKNLDKMLDTSVSLTSTIISN